MDTASRSRIISRLYAELDCLLDTRLGTLAKLDPKLAYETLEEGAYFTREQDKFSRFDHETYLKAYQARDKDTLKHSLLSSCTIALHELCLQLQQQIVLEPYHDSVEVHVNYWPYELDAEEVELMGLSIATKLKGADSVKMVNIPPAELTPLYIKHHYAGMFMYDYDSWMSLHWTPEVLRLFLEGRGGLVICPDVRLFSPAIWFKDPPSQRELEEIERDQLPHPFLALEKGMSSLISLSLEDIRMFSIPDPKARETMAKAYGQA